MRVATIALSLLLFAAFVALSAGSPAAYAADNTTPAPRSEGQAGRQTTPSLRQERMRLLAQIPDSETIVFPASGKQQAVYTIFTDVRCGPCLSTFEASWFRRAALQGDAAAQYTLGLQYAYGFGVEKDEKQVIEWFQKAAALGHEDARKVLQPGASSR